MRHNYAMNTLTQRFEDLSSRGEKALILFFTAGDQPLEQLPQIVDALIEGGADAVEVGIPFSDPFGEGPIIQASSQRSLDRGTTPLAILQQLEKLEVSVPIVTMGYYNPILRMGLEVFAQESVRANCTGTIISDLVPEEADEWCIASTNAGLETVFLVAPTSTQSRIEEVARRTTGFVYVVSRTGVTGTENKVPADVKKLVARVQRLTAKPACVGFGISSPEHVRMVCEASSGAVIGSALVRMLHDQWDDGRGRQRVIDYVRELKAATR